MGVIKYGVALMKNPKTGKHECHAVPNTDKYSFADLAEQASAETTVTRTDCAAVVRAVLDIAKRELLKGNTIDMGDLGTIFITLSSKGEKKVEDFTAASITGVNLRFRPTQEFKMEMSRARFEKTLLKKTAAKALADEQAAMAAKIAALSENDDDDDQEP